MQEICVIGDSGFTFGFLLAGISHIIEVDESESAKDIEKKFLEIVSNKEIGIIVSDTKTTSQISKELKKYLEESESQIFMVLSEDEGSDSLAEKIKNSLGIDIKTS